MNRYCKDYTAITVKTIQPSVAPHAHGRLGVALAVLWEGKCAPCGPSMWGNGDAYMGVSLAFPKQEPGSQA